MLHKREKFCTFWVQLRGLDRVLLVPEAQFFSWIPRLCKGARRIDKVTYEDI